MCKTTCKFAFRWQSDHEKLCLQLAAQFETFVCRQVTFTFPLFCISRLFLYPSLKRFSALKKVFISAISVIAHCASLISYNLFLYSSLIVLFFFSFL